MVNVNLKMVWTKSVNRNSVVVRTEGDNEGRVRWKSLSRVRLFATPGTTQSMEFSRPEYWSGQPFPSPGELPNPGIEPRSPALQADSLPAGPQGQPKGRVYACKKKQKQTQTFLPVQWLRLWALTAGGMGLIPGWGTKIPHAMWCSQKKFFLMS